METIYRTLDARRIAVEALASGGESGSARYALLPRRRPAAPRRDNVLYPEAFRTPREDGPGAAPEALEDAFEGSPEAPAGAESRSARAARWVGLALDFCATAAIIAFTALVMVRLV